jgi:hypothetical protein
LLPCYTYVFSLAPFRLPPSSTDSSLPRGLLPDFETIILYLILNRQVAVIDVSIDDREKDYRVITNSFMRELCRRDEEHNRGQNIDPNLPTNVFNIQAIQQYVLGAYSLDFVLQNLRRYLGETRPDDHYEFLDNETNIRLTDVGRAHCHEFRYEL